MEETYCIRQGFADSSGEIELKKGEYPSKEIMDRINSSRVSDEVYGKLQKGKVLILGLGGLGSHIAVSLLRCGVGKLHLIDYDFVDVTNINRQDYEIGDLGKDKTCALKERLLKINPNAEITTENLRVDGRNIERLFSMASSEGYIVCEAFDEAGLKELVFNTAIRFREVATVIGNGMAGTGSGNGIITRKFGDNIWICGDGESDSEELRGLFAPRVMICAGHMGNTVVRILLGKE